MNVTQSIGLFALAGLCEIGGGWLAWQWLRNGKPFVWVLGGAVVLVLRRASVGRTQPMEASSSRFRFCGAG
jgi:small multidrug resistance family-3 protein